MTIPPSVAARETHDFLTIFLTQNQRVGRTSGHPKKRWVMRWHVSNDHHDSPSILTSQIPERLVDRRLECKHVPNVEAAIGNHGASAADDGVVDD
ncbi:unnamed protein product [Phytophthora lilii]|uniref:Unnamed protein product n=1 Tax=Phytophthora lilii TaxID=2077276 RepID=A0A9W6WQ29_9STRA|nr:unnamed protein product [Phytophthora lilii]